MTMKEDIQELKDLILELQKRIDKLEKKDGWLPYPYTPQPYKKRKCPHCNGKGVVDGGRNPWDDSRPYYLD